MCEVRTVSQQLWWLQWLRQCQQMTMKAMHARSLHFDSALLAARDGTGRVQTKQLDNRTCLIRLVRWGWRRLRAGRGASDHAAAVRGQPNAVCGDVRRLQARHQLRHPLLVQRQHLPVNPCVQGITRVSEQAHSLQPLSPTSGRLHKRIHTPC